MAYYIYFPTFSDEKGDLTVAEKKLPFKIKRFYYIYNVSGQRGGHRHKLTTQALVCLNGSCSIHVNNGSTEANYILDTPDKCLILEPHDWHTMNNFTHGANLLVFASEYYDKDDYIDDEY